MFRRRIQERIIGTPEEPEIHSLCPLQDHDMLVITPNQDHDRFVWLSWDSNRLLPNRYNQRQWISSVPVIAMVRAYGQITVDELTLSGPESLECIRGLRKMWEIYSRVKVVEMNGVHLVAYPIRVTRDGAVEDILIPKQLVEGKKSKMLPPVLTTWKKVFRVRIIC